MPGAEPGILLRAKHVLLPELSMEQWAHPASVYAAAINSQIFGSSDPGLYTLTGSDFPSLQADAFTQLCYPWFFWTGDWMWHLKHAKLVCYFGALSWKPTRRLSNPYGGFPLPSTSPTLMLGVRYCSSIHVLLHQEGRSKHLFTQTGQAGFFFFFLQHSHRSSNLCLPRFNVQK